MPPFCFVRLVVARVAATLTVAALAVPAAAECVFYSEPDFAGDSVAVENNISVPRLGGFWNDNIASVKTSSECEAEIFEHWEYGGGSGVVETFASFQEGSFWADRASSVRCTCAAQSRNVAPSPLGEESDGAVVPEKWTGKGPAPAPSRRGGACIFFDGAEFTGAWRAFRDGETNKGLGRKLFRSVASVRVATGCYALLGEEASGGFWTARDVSAAPLGGGAETSTASCFCR